MIICHKRKRIEKLSPGVPIRKWLISVQEAGYVLRQLGANTATNPKVESRSVIKANLVVLDPQAYPNNAEIDEILDDIL